MESNRRNLLIGGLGIGTAVLGATAVEAQRVVPKHASQVEMLTARQCFLMVIRWDGSDRNNAALVQAKVASDGFDAAAGAYVQQNPGGGDWDEVASFTGMSLSALEFKMTFRRTGGQNYSIWIPVTRALNVSDVEATVSGPYVISGKVVGDFPFPA